LLREGQVLRQPSFTCSAKMSLPCKWKDDSARGNFSSSTLRSGATSFTCSASMSLPCRYEERGEASLPQLLQRRCPGLFAQLQAAPRATERSSTAAVLPAGRSWQPRAPILSAAPPLQAGVPWPNPVRPPSEPCRRAAQNLVGVLRVLCCNFDLQLNKPHLQRALLGLQHLPDLAVEQLKFSASQSSTVFCASTCGSLTCSASFLASDTSRILPLGDAENCMRESTPGVWSAKMSEPIRQCFSFVSRPLHTVQQPHASPPGVDQPVG